MQKSFLSLSLAAVLVTSCSYDGSNTQAYDPSVLVSNDFESLNGWTPANPSLNAEVAHSGRYSIKVGGDQEFSMGFDAELGSISARKPKKIRLEGWAYTTSSDTHGELAMQLVNGATGQLVFGSGILLHDAVKNVHEWVQVSKEIALPDSILPSQHLKVFLWRSYTPFEVYADDIRVTIVE